MTIFETERLRARPLTDDDLGVLHGWWLNPAFRRFLGPSPPALEQFVRAQRAYWDDHFRRHGWGQWAVERKEDGAFLGRCGLNLEPVDGVDEVEVGCALGPPFWGRGYAVEATRATRDWAFRNLRVPHLVSLIHPDNLRSVQLAQATGMKLWTAALWEQIPHHVYRITRCEWESIGASAGSRIPAIGCAFGRPGRGHGCTENLLR